jgi:hypothetical protein
MFDDLPVQCFVAIVKVQYTHFLRKKEMIQVRLKNFINKLFRYYLYI